MATPLDQNLLKFNSVKDDNEEILWSGKPKFIPFTISALSLGTGVFLFVGLYYLMIQKNTEASHSFFVWFAIIPIGIFLLTFFNKILSYNKTIYAYTNKRIMIRTGVVGTDFKSIDYDKILDIQVTVSLVERIFNVGTIKFYTGKTEINESAISKIYERWEAIPHPYEIFKQLKKISIDIKTDFNYPNALRPDINPGYNTKYKPDANSSFSE